MRGEDRERRADRVGTGAIRDRRHLRARHVVRDGADACAVVGDDRVARIGDERGCARLLPARAVAAVEAERGADHEARELLRRGRARAPEGLVAAHGRRHPRHLHLVVVGGRDASLDPALSARLDVLKLLVLRRQRRKRRRRTYRRHAEGRECYHCRVFHCCLLVCVFDVLDVLQIDWIYKIGWSCRTTRGILRLNASVTQRSAAFFDVAALVSEAFTSVIIADIVLSFWKYSTTFILDVQ